MNIKKQYSTRSLGTPTVFSGQKIFFYKEGQWYYGDENTPVTITSQGKALVPDKQPHLYHKGGPETFQKNLELINERINSIHKELTYWDLYKISASVNNASEFYSVFTSLAVGQSMVINCSTFYVNNIAYHKGDVIVKINENQEIKIDSLSTGIYYPSKLTKDDQSNTYLLNFTYAAGEPQEGSSTGPQKEYSYPLSMPENNANIYGQVSKLDRFTFEAIPDIVGGIDYIKPIIKIFTEDNEEIAVDFTLSANTKNYKKWYINNILTEITTTQIQEQEQNVLSVNNNIWYINGISTNISTDRIHEQMQNICGVQTLLEYEITNWKKGPAYYLQIK